MVNKIAIHSVPRSGSTWLGTIFDSHPEVVYKYQPLFSYKFKSFLDEDSHQERIESFFQKIEVTKDDFIDQVEAKSKHIVPSFDKSETVKAVVYKEVRYHYILENLLTTHPEVKVIGLIRDPRATLYSWLNAPKEFRKDRGWKVEEEWLNAPSKNLEKPEEYNGYAKWKEVAVMFESLSNMFPDRFLLVSYKELLNETEDTVRNIFSFSGLSFTQKTEDFILDSKGRTEKDAYSVYRKKSADDKWKSRLSDEIINYIETDLKNTSLVKWLD